ncbi:MAG: hypothetical protein K1X75_12270 [Leptospirales bacterium]|nr:hypothetical protein [Leptospirales bacterium]
MLIRRALDHCLPVLALGFCLILPAPLLAQLSPDRFQSWRTLRTPHFQIHYPEGRIDFAVKTGQIAERLHTELEGRYQSGAENTHITLIFQSDLVNAFATPYGLDQIVLFLENPRGAKFARYDLWLELLIRHEYTHILTLRQWDFQRPLLGFFRILLGFPPNLLSPLAFVEGSAVYEESRPGGGRVNDPYTRMVVRSAILADRFPGLTELMIGGRRWPLGYIYYLYGGRMLHYLSGRYGEDLVPRYWSMDRVPLDVDEGLRGRVNIARGYAEYRESELAEFQQEIGRIEAAGASSFERLTNDGYVKDFLYLGADGRPHYYAAPSDRIAGLYSLEADGESRRIRRTRSAMGFSEAADGSSVYSLARYFAGPLGYRFQLSDNSGWFGRRRLFSERSAAFPQLSADGATLAYVDHDDLRRRLMIARRDADKQWTEERTLLETPFTGFIQDIALSPDATLVAAAVRFGERGQGAIYICPLSGEGCRKLLGGPGVKAQLRFNQDATAVLFTSDVDGVFNLYQVAISDGKATQLTRMRTGAFFPTPSPDGLYALAYFEDGFDLIRFRGDQLLAESTDLFQAPAPEDEPPAPLEAPPAAGEGQSYFPEGGASAEGLAEGWRDEDYSAILSFRPYLLGLLGPLSAFNLAAEGRDPLFRHSLTAAIAPSHPDPLIAAIYDYSRWAIGLSLSYAGNYSKSDRAPGCLREDDPLRFLCDDAYPRFEEARGYFRFLTLGDYLSLQAMLGYASQKLRNARRLRAVQYDARDLNLSGPSFVLLAGDLHYYPQSISAEHGWLLFASSDYYLRSESKDRLERDYLHHLEYGVGEAGLALYLPSLWSHHVNYLNAYGYGSYGPDRELQRVPLSRFVRGQNYQKSLRDHSAAVFTYEYRLPLLTLFDATFEGTPSFRLNQIGLHAFYDVGQVFDRQLMRERWTPAYGAAIVVGLDVIWLSLPEIKISYAHGDGPAGEGQWSVAFNAEFGGDVVGAERQRSPLERAYRHGFPNRREQTGYFRDPFAGGVLQ